MNGENNLCIIPETGSYQISSEIYSSAYKVYQRIFVYPKNWIMQIILLILALDFGYHAGKDPSNTISFLLLFVCIALIAVLWYNPKKIRRNIMDVVRDMEGDEYTFALTDEKMIFRTLPPERIQDLPDEEISTVPPTELSFTSDLRVIEKYEFFLICKGRQIFYVLPKSALYDNQAELMRNTLQKKLGKRFRCDF